MHAPNSIRFIECKLIFLVRWSRIMAIDVYTSLPRSKSVLFECSGSIVNCVPFKNDLEEIWYFVTKWRNLNPTTTWAIIIAWSWTSIAHTFITHPECVALFFVTASRSRWWDTMTSGSLYHRCSGVECSIECWLRKQRSGNEWSSLTLEYKRFRYPQGAFRHGIPINQLPCTGE